MKKIIILILVGLIMFIPTKVYANDKEPINIYVFYGSTCPYCHALFEWFDSIDEDYGYMYNLNKYEVWEDENNANLLNLTASYMQIEVTGVPLLIIGNKYLSGFDEEAYSDAIKESIKEEYLAEERIDIVKEVIVLNNWTPSEVIEDEPSQYVEKPKVEETESKNESNEKEPIYKNNYFRLFALSALIIAVIVIGKKTIYIS